jgi:hypothetical protein
VPLLTSWGDILLLDFFITIIIRYADKDKPSLLTSGYNIIVKALTRSKNLPPETMPETQLYGIWGIVGG